MSSKIKVDTIENVAGSGNVSLGSGHNLVVPGNTSISGDLTMGHDGAIINFGADSDITLTHNHNTGLTLTGTGHTFSSNTYNVIKIQTDSNDDGSNDDAILQWTNGSSNTVKGEIRYDESESKFEIGAGDNQGHIKIDSAGHVTKPLQPAFFARVQNGSAMTDLAVNAYHTVTFNEEIFDQNADYHNSNYTFTAPVTGRYHFDVRLYLLEVPSNTTYIYFSLVTSNNDILMHINDVDSDQYYDFLQGSVLVDMDANDTAYVRFYQPNGSATTHIHHVSSIFSGHLVA